MRTTDLEVDLFEFQNNIRKIKEYVSGKEVMPVIKANAYGTYIHTRLDILEQFKIVAVALVDEGVFLRKEGYQGEIFILNQPSKAEIDLISEYHLTVGISDLSFLKECVSRNADFPVHLEIETGMNRTGILYDDLAEFVSLLKTSNLKVEGIYSHFSSADFDSEYTNYQVGEFLKAKNYLEDNGLSFSYVHISASNGILKCDLSFTNLVRPGIIMYGYDSYPGSCAMLDLKPICKLISHVTFLKMVPEGTKIGYSQKYTCDCDTLVATIPIGYGDGYRRSLSNKGYVYINGKKAPIIGNICMDSFMIDVSGIRVDVGDEVVLFDNEHISLDDYANLCDTINYEVLCTIGERIPRHFKEDL